jgi:DNA-directed RNA polymerase specialized sigma24 family protein
MSPPETELARAFREARKRALAYALTLTKSPPRAEDLVQSAMAAALDPDRSLWDPSVHPDLASHLCNLVLSRHGNESKSYRLKKASHRITDDIAARAADPGDPEKHVLRGEQEAEGDARDRALRARVAKDALVGLLLDHDASGERTSTARALEAGYTLDDIELARARLKRHIQAVVREREATHAPERVEP